MRFGFRRRNVREVEAGIHLSAIVTVEIRKADGRVVYRHQGHNLVTNAGFDWLCAAIGGTPGTYSAHWIALSSETGDASAGDTTLTNEFADADGLDRAVATYAHTGGTKIFTLSKDFTKGAGTVKTPGRAALFSAASGATYVAGCGVPNPPPLTNTDHIVITWTITLS
jgi:hypothetical protein